MPHFVFDIDEDGTIRHIFKNGEPHTEALILEQHFSIVTTYFKASARNLEMLKNEQSNEDRRLYGLQSFLMAMTGIEAFTNTYFHQRSEELDKPEMLSLIGQTHGSITRKIENLLELSGDGPLCNQNELIDRLFKYTKLRNEIIHPRWVPSQISMAGDICLHIDGMVENRQALFEDTELCREMLNWCFLFIARIGQSIGSTDISSFLFHWTGQYELTLAMVLSCLRLPTEDVCQIQSLSNPSPRA